MQMVGFVGNALGATLRCCRELPAIHQRACTRQRIPGTAPSRRLPSPSRMRFPSGRQAAIMTVTPDMFRARHILLSTEVMANSCLEQLNQGAKFGSVASSASSCPSRQRGGELGWFRAGSMASAFEAACSQANVGDIVKAKSEFGWHVILVEGKAVYPKDMSVDELSEIFKQPELRSEYQLVDVREREEVETASVSHFDVLPMSEYESWADDIEHGAQYDQHKPTVVMCHHGMRSAQIAFYLAQQGFTDVYNLKGGIHAWSTRIDSSVPTY